MASAQPFVTAGPCAARDRRHNLAEQCAGRDAAGASDHLVKSVTVRYRFL